MSKMGIRKDWNKGEDKLAAKKGQQKAVKQVIKQKTQKQPVTAGKRTAKQS